MATKEEHEARTSRLKQVQTTASNYYRTNALYKFDPYAGVNPPITVEAETFVQRQNLERWTSKEWRHV